jgi:hypothetical protein
VKYLQRKQADLQRHEASKPSLVTRLFQTHKTVVLRVPGQLTPAYIDIPRSDDGGHSVSPFLSQCSGWGIS